MSTVDFDKQFSKMTNILHGFAYNLTQNHEDAKDLYQETAFRAMKNRSKFRVGTNLKAWLFTIMKNIFINNYRRKVKANTIKDSTNNLYYINAGKVTQKNDGDTNILMDELWEMIDNLEESIRIPFKMHYEGFKYQEIADKMELPLGTIKSKIFFARRELKSKIERLYDNVKEAEVFG